MSAPPITGGRCSACGFALEGLPRHGRSPLVRCPECGAVVDPRDQPVKPRLRDMILVMILLGPLALIAILLIVLLAFIPLIRQGV